MNDQTVLPAEGRPFALLDWLLLVSAAGIWGASFLFMDVALEVEHPGLVTFLRPAMGLFAVLAFPSARRPIDPSDRGRVLLLGITWMAFPLTMFPLAQQWIDSSLTGMLNSAMPVMTVVAGAAFFRVRTGRIQIAGVLVGLVGILLVGMPTATTGGTNALGVALVVAAVTSYGVAAHIAGPLQRRYGSPAVLSRVLAVATVATMPFGVLGFLSSRWAWGAVISNLAVGVGGTGLAFLAAATLIGRVGPVRMSIVTYLVTVVAALLGVLVLGETLSAWQVVGGVVLLGGVWLTSRTDT
ncbi:MAG: DMT family transporter [Acidimicrobiales bacterium]|nr:DMT family transporter [Acidimicrobiales bacterium]MDP6697358.1 DMT family transporter [Acidimicrobiales bacterium]